MTTRFQDTDATRTAVPLMLGIVGPSFSGKTVSALRLATGIQRVTGGDIHMIDTESRRGLHYAPRTGEAVDIRQHTFKFRHVPFAAPFGPLDYLAAIEHCHKRGASVIIVDSTSHEHEGPGGVLEQHDAEARRLAALWKVSEYVTQIPAWAPVKSARRRMINSILQLPVSVIFCFRAKEKIKIQKGKDPENLGWMAIAGEELVFEMTACALLPPGAAGVPRWQSKLEGEQSTIKLPAKLAPLFGDGPLSEDIGESLARWASGEVSVFETLLRAVESAANDAELGATLPRLEEARTGKRINAGEVKSLREAVARRRAELGSVTP